MSACVILLALGPARADVGSGLYVGCSGDEAYVEDDGPLQETAETGDTGATALLRRIGGGTTLAGVLLVGVRRRSSRPTSPARA